METEKLPEVMHKVDEDKFRQQVRNKPAARVLGLIHVHIEIYQHDGVLNLEACQRFL